ncbi:MAG: glycosyltransferase family 1 protein [Gammaproteobacteria bacterium]|nr:MAG: glycosyltransferase family 1 protein [Gammaproteobacteria bacterium]
MTHLSSQPTNIQRLAIVTETWPPDINGVANTLNQLYQVLVQRMEVDLVRPRPRHPSGPLAGLQVRGFPLPGYPELQFGMVSARKLIRHWLSRRPDAVYVATQGPLGWSAIKAARRLAIPVASGFHTNFHAYSSHYGVGFMEALIRLYLRHFHNQTRVTLAPTPDIQAQVTALGVRDVRVWGRGVDAQRFNPALRSAELRRQWGLTAHDLAVIYVGRLAAEKNLEQVVSSYARIRAQVPTARLVLVGDGPCRKRLQRRHPEFIYAGMQQGRALAEHYASGDLFLFPSETETFGNVVLEAMASGLAVVAYDRAAARIHIENGRSGITVPPGDEQAFSAAALQLATRPSLLTRLKRAAREHAQHQSWPRMADVFLEVISLAIRNEAHHANATPSASRSA